MHPVVFRDQLKRTFGLSFSRQELGALVHVFDSSGDGTVSGSEFLRTFFQLGFEQRTKERTKMRSAETQRLRKMTQDQRL